MPSKPGPKPKGVRSAVTCRVPVEHRDVYEQRAEQAGLPLGDYVMLCLAKLHELDEPEYIHRERNRYQEALPIGA